MTRVRRCTVCGTTDDVAIDNLCDDCLHEKSQRIRADQGLPPTIQDRDALARIATILRFSPASAAGAPTDRGRPAAPAGSWDGAPTGAAGSSAPPSGKSSARTSGTERVAPVVPLNENTRRRSASRAASTGA